MNRTLIGIDPAAIPNPATGQLYYDRTVQVLKVFNGVTWQAISDNEIQYCVICQKSDWSHNEVKLNEPFPDHPFVGNNLEMLEWEYERSIRR